MSHYLFVEEWGTRRGEGGKGDACVCLCISLLGFIACVNLYACVLYMKLIVGG